MEAVVDGEPCDLGSPKQQAVLALLALSPARVVSMDRLIDELWDDGEPGAAASSLQVYVSRLRRAFRTASEHTQVDGAAPTVVRRAPGYLLDVAPQQVDTCAFGELLARARDGAPVSPRERIAALDQALGLVRGPALADVVDRLGQTGAIEARRLDEGVVAARELRVDLTLQHGDAHAAAADAAALAAAHPLRESVHGLLMRARYRAGRQAEALAAYEALRARLADELGADPGPELRRLHTQVLRQDPALDGIRPEAAVAAAEVATQRTTGHPTLDDPPPPAPLPARAGAVLDVLAVAEEPCALGLLAELTSPDSAELDTAIEALISAGLVVEDPPGRARLTEAADGVGRLARLDRAAVAETHGRLGLGMAGRPGEHEAQRTLEHLVRGLAALGSSRVMPALWRALDRLDGPGRSADIEAAAERVEDALLSLPRDAEVDTWLPPVLARRATLAVRRVGWLDPSVGRLADRVRPGVAVPQVRAEVLGMMYDRLTAHVMAGRYGDALAQAGPLLERSGRPESTGAAYHMLGRLGRGVVAWTRGEALPATSDLRRALSLTHTLPDVASSRYGTPSVLARAVLALALLDAGHDAEALDLTEDNLGLAEEASHEDACILRLSAASVHAQRGDVTGARGQAALTHRLAELQGLPGLAALGAQVASWGLLVGVAAVTDDRERLAVLEQQRRAHDSFAAFGVHFMRPIYDCLLAESELVSGFPDRACVAAEDGLAAAESGHRVIWEARLRDASLRARRAADLR